MFNQWERLLFLGVSEAFLSTWPCSSASQLHGWGNQLMDGAEFEILVGASLDTEPFFFFEQLET